MNKLTLTTLGAMLVIILCIIGTDGCNNTEENASSKSIWGNKMVGDWGTDYFDKAILTTPTGNIEVGVKEWCEYEDTATILITTTDNKRYYISEYNCILICTEAD